jgi:hypothetical protein
MSQVLYKVDDLGAFLGLNQSCGIVGVASFLGP